MIYTSAQHRRRAELLREKALALPECEKAKTEKLLGLATFHLAMADAQDRNPRLRPKRFRPPREQLSYRHMLKLADVMEGWALNKKFAPDPLRSSKILAWADSLRELAAEVGPDWDPPTPQRLSILGYIGRLVCGEV